MSTSISGPSRSGVLLLTDSAEPAISRLLDQIRADPEFQNRRSEFEFRLVDGGNGRYLELRDGTTFGSCREMTAQDATRLQIERDGALALLATELGDELADNLFDRLKSTTSHEEASRIAASFAMEHASSAREGQAAARSRMPPLDGLGASHSGAEGPKPGIPETADLATISQYHGTNTCWALATLAGCLQMKDGRAFINDCFTKTADGYQLKLADGTAIRVTRDDLDTTDRLRREAARTQDGGDIYGADRREEWLRAFEFACTRISTEFKDAAIDPRRGQGLGSSLADRIGLKSADVMAYKGGGHHGLEADALQPDASRLKSELTQALAESNSCVLVRMSGHWHLLHSVESDSFTLISTLGGKAESPDVRYQPAQTSKTLTTEAVLDHLKRENIEFVKLTLPPTAGGENSLR
jgi:hypothetical protein